MYTILLRCVVYAPRKCQPLTFRMCTLGMYRPGLTNQVSQHVIKETVTH